MDGFMSIVTPESSSTHSMSGQQSSGFIPAWDEVLDDPMRHQQQMSTFNGSNNINTCRERNLLTFLQQNPMPSTVQVQDPYQNQLGPQELQNQLQRQNLQSTQHYPKGPPGQMPLPEDQSYFQNRGHLQGGMMYDVPQVMQQQFQQHIEQQIYKQQLRQQFQQNIEQHLYQEQLQHQTSLHPILPSLPHSSMCTNAPPPSIPEPRKSVVCRPTEPNPDQAWREKMQEFINTFIKRRKLLGFSQDAVFLELQKLPGKQVKKTHISFFERIELRFQDMCDIKSQLELWMENIQTELRNAYSSEDAPETPNLHWREDKSISASALIVLREAFHKNPNPDVEQIEKLAKSLEIDKLSVTVWFYNGRRIRKMSLYPPADEADFNLAATQWLSGDCNNASSSTVPRR